MTGSTRVCQRPVDVDLCPFLLWAVRHRCVEKRGCGFVIRSFTCSSKFADQLSQRVVLITKFLGDFLLRSSVHKDGSQRFVLSLQWMFRLSKKPLTCEIDHDHCLPENVSRFFPPGRLNRTRVLERPKIKNSPRTAKTHRKPRIQKLQWSSSRTALAAEMRDNRLTLRSQKMQKTLAFLMFTLAKCEVERLHGNRR